MHHRCIQHSFHPRVLPISRAAAAHIRQVIALLRLPDVRPLAPRLQLQFFFLRHRQFPRRACQLSVTQFLPAGLVHHHAHLRAALLLRHSPLRRRRAHQHQPPARSRFSQRVKKTSHRVRPVRILVAILLIPAALHHLYAAPIRIQFIRHNHRQTRAVAAAHLRAVRHDVDRPIRRDRQIHVRPQRSIRHSFRGASFPRRQHAPRHVSRAQYQRARAHNPFQKSASAHILNLDHVSHPAPNTSIITDNPSTSALYPTRNPSPRNLFVGPAAFRYAPIKCTGRPSGRLGPPKCSGRTSDRPPSHPSAVSAKASSPSRKRWVTHPNPHSSGGATHPSSIRAVNPRSHPTLRIAQPPRRCHTLLPESWSPQS